jgi:hypothetical protein
MSDMSKLASQVPGIMQMAAQHLRKVASENVQLVQSNEELARENRVMKLARRMDVRGLEPNLSFEEKIAKLQEVPVEKLASLEQAIEMAAGGVNLARVATRDDSAGAKLASDIQRGELYRSNEAGTDSLDDFIASQDAFSHG